VLKALARNDNLYFNLLDLAGYLDNPALRQSLESMGIFNLQIIPNFVSKVASDEWTAKDNLVII
jgi:hypothetical protein